MHIRSFILVLTCASIAVAAPGSTPTAPISAADKAKKTAQVLVQQGADALALGDFKAARDCFVDVLQVDPRNRKSLEGLGYCYIKLDDPQRAMRSLEGALTIPEAPSRSLSMNLAMSLLRTRNPMRAAKILRDYMLAHPDPIDEEILNAFAICVGQASDEARVNRLFDEFLKFYDTQNTRLEQTKPGMKRWGVEWISQEEWSKKDNYNKGIQKQLDGKWRTVVAANNDYKRAKAQYDATINSRFRGNAPALEAQMKQDKQRVDTLQGEYNAMAQKLDRPPLPKVFSAVPLDDGMAVASAGRSPGETVESPAIRPPASPPPLTRNNPPPPIAPPVTAPAPPAVKPPPPAVAVNPPPTTPPAVAPTIPEPPAITPPRKPARAIVAYAAGVAVSPKLVVTTTGVLEGATRITLQAGSGDVLEADVVHADAKSGLALIRVRNGALNYLNLAGSFGGGAVQCACFPTPSIFDPEPALVTGSAPAATKEAWNVRLTRHPRLPGSPLISEGKIVGVVTAPRDADVGQLSAATLDQVRALIGNTPLPAAARSDPLSSAVMITVVRGKQP